MNSFCPIALFHLAGAAISILVVTTALAAEPADLSPLLNSILAKHTAPGIVGAVVEDGKITALGAAGVRKAGSAAAMTPRDLIHLGSDTKAMTAVLIGQLIEKEQLSFDSTMAQVFPDLAGQMNAAMASVTVEELLCHTGGLPNNLDWWSIDRSGQSLSEQRRAVVHAILSAAPLSEPGTTFSYSNADYVVLGAILDRKTHRPWEALIRTNLFEPLHMSTAGFGPPGTGGGLDQPWGHVLQNGAPFPMQADNAPVMDSCGRVHCSISDWAKFVSLFLPNGVERHPLISAAILHQLLTPPAGQDYAGGWIIADRPWAGGTAYTHSGSNTMWFCTAWLAPQKNFATLVAINYGGDDAFQTCDDATGALIQFHESQAGGPR